MAVEFECPKCHFDNPVDARLCRKCGFQFQSQEEIILTEKMTAKTPISELTTGSTFASKYQVIEELGTGGMGKVYKVLDKEIDEIVALKLIKPAISTHKKTIERFKNELKLTRNITHKNVCRMYDLNKLENTYYITMEYVPGEDLKDFIRRAALLSIARAVSIARQVFAGLAEAHKLGVVHRDLKSNNIMIDSEGNVRIMDFGIARSMKTKSITESGVMIGTPEYMSPEQAEAKKIDELTDIYSAGVILYEMVTGQLPFAGDTPLSIAMKHKGEIPRPPRELNPQIPDDLNRLILKCLEKEKDDRYQNAEAVLAELTKVDAGIPTTDRVIPKRKPITSREITVSLSLRKLLFPALIVLAVILVVVTIWNPWSREKIAPIPSDKLSIAVLYFKNNSGDPSLDIWRNALAESLISDLHQSKYMRVLSANRLFGILRKFDLLETQSYAEEELNKIASAGQINHILLGSFSRAGDIFRIETTLHDINSGEVVDSERVEGTGEESFFSMVDELTRRIKSGLNLSAKLIANDIDRKISIITTSSPEALKYYSESFKFFRKRDTQRGISLVEKAIAADPGFAMAYRQLATVYYNLRNTEKNREYSNKAMELSDRISDRERYIIQGGYYGRSSKTLDKAIEAYNKLLDLYPDNATGIGGLSGNYFRMGKNDKAIEFDEKLRQLYPKNAVAHYNSAFHYFSQGLYKKAEEMLKYYEKNVSENDGVIKQYLAWSLLLQNKYDLALTEIDRGISLSPSNQSRIVIKGDIYLFKGDFINAEIEYNKFPEKKADDQFRRIHLGALYLLQGKIEDSKVQVEKGLELQKERGRHGMTPDYNLQLAYRYLRFGNKKKALELCNEALSYAIERESSSWQSWALYFKGLTLIGMKSLDQTQQMAAELKRLAEESLNEKYIRWYYHLLGLIELEKKNITKAVEYLKKAILLLDFECHISSDLHALFIEPLALAYYQSGDLEKAQIEYEKIILLTYGRLYYGDIYTRSFYMLGKIFEKKAYKGKAIENYEKFLEILIDADPGITEIEDAKKRLATLLN